MKLKMFAVLGLVAGLLGACSHHPTPPHGHGGFAEWDWPWQTEDGEVYEAPSNYNTRSYYKTRSYERAQPKTRYERPDRAGVWYDQPPHGMNGLWSYQVPHPDYLPTVFRTTELRLRRHQEGCAVHYMPAFVVQAEKQWNKALRAFAGELYQDAFHDLRQLNLRLDEIEHRMAVVHGPKGSYTPAGCVGTDPTLPCNRGCVGPAFTGGYCGAVRPGHMGPAIVAPYMMYGCAQRRQKHWPCNDCAPTQNGQQAHQTAPVASQAAPMACRRPAAQAPSHFAAGMPSAAQVPATFSGNYFQHDSDVVTPEFSAYLAQLAQFFRHDPTVSYVVHGHADRSGGDGYNLELSQRRAANVAKVLMAHGVPYTNIAQGYFGEQKPAPGSNPGPDGRERLDRRVEIFLNRSMATSFWTGYCSSWPTAAHGPVGYMPQHLLTMPLPVMTPHGH